MNVFKLFSTHLIINIAHIIVYVLLGLVIPVLLNLEMISVLFSWIIAPIVTIILIDYALNYFKIQKAKYFISISFIVNLLIIGIYTWIESLQPRIPGDFLDFRGLMFMFLGIGQILGIVFAMLYYFFRSKKSVCE